MEWKVEYIQNEGIILLTVSGCSTLEAVVNIAKDCLKEARQNKAEKVLCDYRNVSSRLSTLEVYDLPKVFVDAGLKYSDKVALVYSASKENTSNLSFFDTRCSNSSLKIKVFTDYDEAYMWLTT